MAISLSYAIPNADHSAGRMAAALGDIPARHFTTAARQEEHRETVPRLRDHGAKRAAHDTTQS
jgi:hypothetical protein